MRAKIVSLLIVLSLALGLVPSGALSSAAAAPPRASTLEKVSSRVQPGILYMETKWTGRVYDPSYGWVGGPGKTFHSTSSCSGFFVSPEGHFVSAGHCVERSFGRQDVLVEAAEWSFRRESWTPETTVEDVIKIALESWKVHSVEDPARHGADRAITAAYGVEIAGIPSGKALPARVLGARPFDQGDVALLKVEAENVPVLELAPDAEIEVGTEVVSVGYPANVDMVTDATFDPSFKEGSISSEKTIHDGLMRVYEISGAMAGGMSGGPTVDLRGRVIGVNSFGATYETEAFNFVSPAAEVDELLRDKGVENRLGRINSTYREGLAAYYAGDREAALAAFDEVLAVVGSHEFAQQFRAKALRLPRAQTGGTPLALVGGLVALVLVALAAGVLVLLRRRGRPGSDEPDRPQPPHPPRPGATAAPVAPAPAGGSDTARTPVSNGVGPAATLVGTSGPLAGMRIPVSAELVLGRGMVDVRIHDPQVSWQHASVWPANGGLAITDLESANGTLVNDRRIEGSVQLADGDELRLGQTTLRVEVRPDAGRRRDTTPASLAKLDTVERDAAGEPLR
jgi:serine protease Do